MAEILILSVATFFNIIILHLKYKRKRYADLTIDVIIFLLLGSILGGTVTGFAVATVTSALLSAYLLAQPLGGSDANN